jgi:hypothetical protein
VHDERLSYVLIAAGAAWIVVLLRWTWDGPPYARGVGSGLDVLIRMAGVVSALGACKAHPVAIVLLFAAAIVSLMDAAVLGAWSHSIAPYEIWELMVAVTFVLSAGVCLKVGRRPRANPVPYVRPRPPARPGVTAPPGWQAPSIGLQMTALCGDGSVARDLVAAALPGMDSRAASALVFNVTRDEALAWLREHKKLSDFVSTTPGSRDGVYIVRSGAGFELYEQERGGRFRDRTLPDEEAAWNVVLDQCLVRGGVTLYE